MRKLILLLALLLIPVAFACKPLYLPTEDVIIVDGIVTAGYGADCNCSLYVDNVQTNSLIMNRTGLAYVADFGVLPENVYVANIECNLTNITFVGQCKFIVGEDDTLSFLEGNTMNIGNIFFIIQLLGLLAIFGYNLYNVFSVGKTYDFKIVTLSFVFWFILYGIGLFTFILNPTVQFYSVMFRLETMLTGLYVMLVIVQVIFLIKQSTAGVAQMFGSGKKGVPGPYIPKYE
jgi:hypothetical protein